MDNKLTGSFYTPQKLIEYMAKYISGRITPQSILEPSAGDGRFIPTISIFNCPITAVELYKEKADALHMHFGEKCEANEEKLSKLYEELNRYLEEMKND